MEVQKMIVGLLGIIHSGNVILDRKTITFIINSFQYIITLMLLLYYHNFHFNVHRNEMRMKI